MTMFTPAALAVAMLAAAGGGLTGKDKAFADKAAMDGMKEVAASRLAADHAMDADVKSFAQTMIADHGKANDTLKGLAGDKGWQLPADMDAKRRKDVDALGAKHGADFDRAYADAMRKDHDDAVKLFRDEAEHGKEPALQGFAKDTLPTLEHHQAMAKDLKPGS